MWGTSMLPVWLDGLRFFLFSLKRMQTVVVETAGGIFTVSYKRRSGGEREGERGREGGWGRER